MSNWTCHTCQITIKSTSKSRHIKTNKHILNLKPQPFPSKDNEVKVLEDCTICTEPMRVAKHCRSCKQEWCRKCDRNISKCPYCRVVISGRQEQARVQARNNHNWYASSEAFRPEPQPDIDRFRVIHHEVEPQPNINRFRVIHHEVEAFVAFLFALTN